MKAKTEQAFGAPLRQQVDGLLVFSNRPGVCRIRPGFGTRWRFACLRFSAYHRLRKRRRQASSDTWDGSIANKPAQELG